MCHHESSYVLLSYVLPGPCKKGAHFFLHVSGSVTRLSDTPEMPFAQYVELLSRTQLLSRVYEESCGIEKSTPDRLRVISSLVCSHGASFWVY